MVVLICVSLRWFEKHDKMLTEPYCSGFLRGHKKFIIIGMAVII